MNEGIEEYRTKDRENHCKKTQDVLNVNEVEPIIVVSSENDVEFDNMNQVNVANNNVLIKQEIQSMKGKI